MIDFFVAGTPVTQGSKSAIRVGNRAVVVEGKSKKARDGFAAWRHAIATEARAGADRFNIEKDLRWGWPISTPVIVTLTFGLQKPASAPKTRRTWPTGARSGDVDKLARAALDAITGVLVADDAQVVGLSVTKTYGRPGVRLQLWAEADDERWVPEWHFAPVGQLVEAVTA